MRRPLGVLSGLMKDMSILKFEDEKMSDSAGVAIPRPDLKAQYEKVVGRTLSIVVRQWKLVTAVTAATLALACIVIPLMPRQYSASALIYPTLFSADEGKFSALGTVEAGSIVSSEARLIVSDPVLHAVVKRLDLAGRSPSAEATSWPGAVQEWFRAALLPETRNSSALERQVAQLRNRIAVAKDPRSYLITISMTAASAEQAATIVNAIALEYMRSKRITRAQIALAVAETELVRQLGVYGDRHPKVLHAQDSVEAARSAMNAAARFQDGELDAVSSDEAVKLAVPNRTPTSPKGLLILGMSALVGLLLGGGVALWWDRRGIARYGLFLGFLGTQARADRRSST